MRIRLPLNWKTRGYFGVIFGGSIYAAADPIYMALLNKLLGKEYIAWDKSATVHFKRPANTTLYATFVITEDELNAVRAALQNTPRVDRIYHVTFAGEDGTVYATVEKVVNIRKKNPSESKSPVQGVEAAG